jgi:hypothetical protein
LFAENLFLKIQMKNLGQTLLYHAAFTQHCFRITECTQLLPLSGNSESMFYMNGFYVKAYGRLIFGDERKRIALL